MIKLDTLATFYVIDSILDEATGKRYKAIINQSSILVTTEEVGTETYYSSYAQQMQLNKTIQMRKMSYRNQMYVTIKGDSTVYQVARVAKGVTMQFIKLPLQECMDSEVVAIING